MSICVCVCESEGENVQQQRQHLAERQPWQHMSFKARQLRLLSHVRWRQDPRCAFGATRHALAGVRLETALARPAVLLLAHQGDHQEHRK